MMASKNSTSSDNSLSFAKIVAMPPPLKLQASPASDDGNDSQPPETNSSRESPSRDGILSDQDRLDKAQRDVNVVDRDVDRLSRAVQGVHLPGRKDREHPESSGDTQENGTLKRETSFEDDRTHLSNSSTKPTSFDSKSMASVTTFAMDEKDSLRPDDSASVQAIDEEESLSGPASGAPNSLTGSESGARGFRDHVRDINSQRSRGILHNLQNPGPVFNDANPRPNGVISPEAVANNFVDGRSVHGFPLEPDEKLLEAMKSSKDRLLILQLEEKVRHFIQNTKEESLELPPSNAFGRLLAHKLGDYYHLTHFVDNNVTSVRLHRTPFCRLPMPLSDIAAINSTPPPPMPAMKIMRRNDGERPSTEGSTAASSSVPSKTASEAGDGNDGDRAGSSSGPTSVKDRLILTREEREAKYQEARERIFRDFPESRSSDNSAGDQGNMSRSSSASGRKKTHRQKTPHDDSFEVRSQYNVYYPGVPYTNGPVPYQVAVHDPTFHNQPSFMVGPGITPPNMGYAPSVQTNTMYSGHMHSMPQYPMPPSPQMPPAGPWPNGNMPQQPTFPGYTPIAQPPVMMNPQASTKSSPAMSNYAVPNTMQYHQPAAHWPAPPYPGNFSQGAHRNPHPAHWPNYPPQQLAGPTSYPYGQFPPQPLAPGMQNVTHPLPGSFNRSLFNPQTRSFIPGGAPPGRHPGRNNQPTMNSSYQGISAIPPQQWPGFPDATSRNQESAGYSGNQPSRGMPYGNRDSIAKWGTPSHLPPKPPPSEVPSDFAIRNRNGSVSASSYGSNVLPNGRNGPLVVSGGTSLPKTN